MGFVSRLIELLKSIGVVVNLSEVWALVKAASPLPATPEEIPAWLGRVGIVEPLQAVVARVACAVFFPGPHIVAAFGSEGDFLATVEDEADAQGLDPQTILLVLEIAKTLWGLWQTIRR